MSVNTTEFITVWKHCSAKCLGRAHTPWILNDKSHLCPTNLGFSAYSLSACSKNKWQGYSNAYLASERICFPAGVMTLPAIFTCSQVLWSLSLDHFVKRREQIMMFHLLVQRVRFRRFPSQDFRKILPLLPRLNSFPLLWLFRDKCPVLHGWPLILLVWAERFYPRGFPWKLHLTLAHPPTPMESSPLSSSLTTLTFYHLMLFCFLHGWHDTYLFCLPPLEHQHSEGRSMLVYVHCYL